MVTSIGLLKWEKNRRNDHNIYFECEKKCSITSGEENINIDDWYQSNVG